MEEIFWQQWQNVVEGKAPPISMVDLIKKISKYHNQRLSIRRKVEAKLEQQHPEWIQFMETPFLQKQKKPATVSKKRKKKDDEPVDNKLAKKSRKNARQKGKKVESNSSILTKDAISIIRKSLLTSPTLDVILQVADINRFYRDRSCNDLIPEVWKKEGWNDSENDLDMFELTVHDGVYKMRAVLAPICNELIQTGKIHQSSLIRVREACNLYDEFNLSKNNKFAILGLIEPHHTETAIVDTEFNLQWDSESNEVEVSVTTRPLIGKRKFFAPLYDDVFFYKLPGWDAKVPEYSSLEPLISEWDLQNKTLINLSALTNREKAVVRNENRSPNSNNTGSDRLHFNQHYLLAKIVDISAPLCYAKVNDRSFVAAWPIKRELILFDGESYGKCVIWGKAVQTFINLAVGDVLLFRDMVVKVKGEMEIQINDTKGTWCLVKITEAAKTAIERKRSLRNNQERLRIGRSLEGLFVKRDGVGDVGGTVVSVGQNELVFMSAVPDHSSANRSISSVWGHRDFHPSFRPNRMPYKWIRLLDSQCNCIVPVQVFASSNLHAYDSISPGDVVFLKNVSMESITTNSKSIDRVVFGKSSLDTRLYTAAEAKELNIITEEHMKSATLDTALFKQRLERIESQSLSIHQTATFFYRDPELYSPRVQSFPIVKFSSIEETAQSLRVLEIKMFIIKAWLLNVHSGKTAAKKNKNMDPNGLKIFCTLQDLNRTKDPIVLPCGIDTMSGYSGRVVAVGSYEPLLVDALGEDWPMSLFNDEAIKSMIKKRKQFHGDFSDAAHLITTHMTMEESQPNIFLLTVYKNIKGKASAFVSPPLALEFNLI